MRIKKENLRIQERQSIFFSIGRVTKNTGDLCARCRKK